MTKGPTSENAARIAVHPKRLLREEKLLETAAKVKKRIGERFPDSGLLEIAGEVEEVSEALARAAAIRRPNWWLRAGLGLLLVIALVSVLTYAPSREEQVSFWRAAAEFIDSKKLGAAILMGAGAFLVSLEARLKRRRALRAVHELRALAHLLDMFQLTKSPERVGHPADPVNVAGRALTAEDMTSYLIYCTELLALLSKVGHIYSRDFPDPAAEAAVDRFENLVVGLSSKIWQKIMVLDRIRSGAGGEPKLSQAGLVQADVRD